VIKLINLLKEDNQTYDYGCVMLYFDFPKMNLIHSIIKKSDIYTEEGDRSFGLETEPHTTLLYGLHEEVTTDQIKNVIRSIIFSSCEIKDASIFENEKYDVLKFNVSGEGLVEANNLLKQFPFTSNYPDYHPHMTIAYIKSGIGEKYAELLKDIEFILTPSHCVYSKPNGEKEIIRITQQ
jgi:2'-5' RNA ligase